MATKKTTAAPDIDIGLSKKDRQAIAAGLARLLADSYTLYLKTHNYHWNVTGPMFNTLHLMFEGQYTELALAVDSIAERIRALGEPAPGSYRAYSKLTGIPEEEGVRRARALVRRAEREYGHELIGFRHGWRGVIEDETMPLTVATTRGLLHRDA